MPSPQHMTCMEVWGGNQPADSDVVMAGLDAWVYCKPYGQADGGGDVYYVSACATGRITRLLIADVSGHGTAVATIAIELRRLMRKFVNYIDQSAFVRLMNQQFAQLSSAGTFATAIVSTFFGPTNDLTMCVAGHPPPMLYRAATRQWTILPEGDSDAGNIPLGIDDVSDWSQFGMRLNIGDLVFCYTDSLIEAKGADGEMLGPAGLRDILATINTSDPKQMIASLLEAVASRVEGNLDKDDVTILLFRPNGTCPSVPLKDKLLAPLRVIGGALSALRPGGQPIPWPEVSIANVGGLIFRSLNSFRSRRNRTAPPPARE